MERGALGVPYLAAVGLGTLSWLTAVIIVTALLLGGLLLLNALVQRYVPRHVSQARDSVPPATTAVPAAEQQDQQRVPAGAAAEPADFPRSSAF
jgi:hypothetical protein